jgi:hypothetical protein
VVSFVVRLPAPGPRPRRLKHAHPAHPKAGEAVTERSPYAPSPFRTARVVPAEPAGAPAQALPIHRELFGCAGHAATRMDPRKPFPRRMALLPARLSSARAEVAQTLGSRPRGRNDRSWQPASRAGLVPCASVRARALRRRFLTSIRWDDLRPVPPPPSAGVRCSLEQCPAGGGFLERRALAGNRQALLDTFPGMDVRTRGRRGPTRSIRLSPSPPVWPQGHAANPAGRSRATAGWAQAGASHSQQ